MIGPETESTRGNGQSTLKAIRGLLLLVPGFGCLRGRFDVRIRVEELRSGPRWAVRYLVATKSRTVTQRKLRGVRAEWPGKRTSGVGFRSADSH